MVSHERPRRGPARHELHHRRFGLHEVSASRSTRGSSAGSRHACGRLPPPRDWRSGRDSAAGSGSRYRRGRATSPEAAAATWRARGRPRANTRELTGSGAKQTSFDRDDVADIALPEGLETIVAELLALDVDLQPSVAILQVQERGLSEVSHADDAPGDHALAASPSRVARRRSLPTASAARRSWPTARNRWDRARRQTRAEPRASAVARQADHWRNRASMRVLTEGCQAVNAVTQVRVAYSRRAARPTATHGTSTLAAAVAQPRSRSRDEGASRHVLGPPVVSVHQVRFLPPALRACRSAPSSRDRPLPPEMRCRSRFARSTNGSSQSAPLPPRGDDARCCHS